MKMPSAKCIPGYLNKQADLFENYISLHQGFAEIPKEIAWEEIIWNDSQFCLKGGTHFY